MANEKGIKENKKSDDEINAAQAFVFCQALDFRQKKSQKNQITKERKRRESSVWSLNKDAYKSIGIIGKQFIEASDACSDTPFCRAKRKKNNSIK